MCADVASPPATAVQFGSISPGDVESISEGEIPEADPDAEPDSAQGDASSVPPQLTTDSASPSDNLSTGTNPPAGLCPVMGPIDSSNLSADTPSQDDSVDREDSTTSSVLR